MGAFKGRPALMFAAGPETEYGYIEVFLRKHEHAVIACADGGLYHARAMGLTPELLVGDFDSCDEETGAGEVIRLEPEKDDTDTQHCMRELIMRGCTEITVVCAMGGRLDHMLANLSLVEQAAELGAKCMLLDAKNLAFLHDGGRKHFKTQPQYHYFSIIPLDYELQGVTIEHAKYPLDCVNVSRPGMISISNQPIKDCFEIEIQRGKALIVLSTD